MVFFYNLFYTLVEGARAQFSHSFPVCLDRSGGLFKGGVGGLSTFFLSLTITTKTPTHKIIYLINSNKGCG